MMERQKENVSVVCAICLKDESRYTCPRCNLRYCSVSCYKDRAHAECSEGFYKDCFMEGLKDFSASSEEKKNMVEILKRVETDSADCISDEDSEDDSEIDLAERLQGVSIESEADADKVWNLLSDKEKKEFQKMTSDGRLGNLLEIWTPWWDDKAKKFVEEIQETLPTQRDKPAIVTDVPDITKLLTKSKPSADVKHNMVNILYSYVYMCRLHNGSHMDCLVDSVEVLMDTSDVIRSNQICGSPSEAIQLCMQCVQKVKYCNGSSREFNISVVEDVIKVLSGPSAERPLEYVMMALSDILLLLKKASKDLTKDIKNRDQKTSVDLASLKKQVFQARKKIEFMLGWTQRFGMVLETMVPELQLELCSLSGDLEEVNSSKVKLEEEWGGKQKPKEKILIEEIT